MIFRAILCFMLSAGLHAVLLFSPLPGDWLRTQKPASAPVPKAMRLTFAAPRSSAAAAKPSAPPKEKPAPPKEPPAAPAKRERGSFSAASLGASDRKAARQGETVAAAPNPAAADYLARLKEHLIPYRQYPQEARFWRWEGVAHIRFTLDGEGRILNRSLRKSSSHAALDSEALALISRAEPYPPPPLPKGEDSMTILLPILFTLRPDAGRLDAPREEMLR